MTNKWILIVDDEEGILSVLKNSLKRLGDEYRVATAPNGDAALKELEQRPFDLVVTDYKMAGMDGLELLEKVHSNWPETRLILMTAYGNTSVEAEATRLKVYRYLAKPLEIETFRQSVKEAVGSVASNPLGILFFSERDYSEINQVLYQLLSAVGARCVFLTDSEGRYIAGAGVVADLPLARMASLLGGSMATLIEAGCALDNNEDVTNLAYREGRNDNLYVINVGLQFLLIIIIERGPSSSRLGTVWYCAQRTVAGLREKFGQVRPAGSEDVLGENLEQSVFGELQKILADTGPTNENGKQDQSTRGNYARPASEKTEQGKPGLSASPRLLSFEAANLINAHFDEMTIQTELKERDRS